MRGVDKWILATFRDRSSSCKVARSPVIREPSAVGSFWHAAVRLMGKRLPMHCPPSEKLTHPLGHFICSAELNSCRKTMSAPTSTISDSISGSVISSF